MPNEPVKRFVCYGTSLTPNLIRDYETSPYVESARIKGVYHVGTKTMSTVGIELVFDTNRSSDLLICSQSNLESFLRDMGLESQVLLAGQNVAAHILRRNNWELLVGVSAQLGKTCRVTTQG